MTLLKENSYKSINIALLSLEQDIKNKTFDTSAIEKQLVDINERIDEINAGSNSSSSDVDNSAEINDLRAEVENINSEIDAINGGIDDIEQKLSKIFLAENYVEDFDTAIEPGVYYWNTNTTNRPANYGVLVVYEKSEDSNNSWIYQTAYATDAKIYYRVKINELEWKAWQAIAYEDITKTYTIPDVTTPTARYIKLGTFPWHFAETVKVVLSGANFEDTVEFNVLGGNGGDASVNGWYTTNSGKTTGIYVVPVAPVTFASNIEVWLRVEQYTTLTVKLTGSSTAAQYFNTNPQMNNTQTYPTGAKVVSYFHMKRGYFGYNENTLNCYETTMTEIGFAQNQVVSLTAFAQAVINYTGTNKGRVFFVWQDAGRAYIKATTPYNTQLEINGGTLTFNSRSLDADAAWNTFDAQYINRTGELYTFGIQVSDSSVNEFVRREVDTSTTNVLRKNVDAGYLCKHYDIGSLYQTRNVILLGKIPDPASTAAPATPSTSWDIDVDFYFVRPQGHKASWCNVKAGYGYSNAWRKYGFIETFGIDMSSSYNNPFYLVTLKYNNEYYIAVRHDCPIDGNYAARVKNVNISGNRNPSTVANTTLANMLKIIPYQKTTDNTVLNSEINSSIVEMPNTYAPTIQTTSSLVLRNTTDLSLSSFGQEPLSIGTITGDNLGLDGNEIQARFNGKVAPLYINGSGGKVVINDTNNSNGGLQVGGNTTLLYDTDVSLSSFGLEPLSIGTKTGTNLGIDSNEIQARSNGAASNLYLNNEGGTVDINYEKNSGNGGLRVGGSTTLRGSSNVGLSNFGLEPLSIGDKTGKNIGIDGDDIQARNNGAASSLDLNYFGGTVRVNAQGLANSGLQVGGNTTLQSNTNVGLSNFGKEPLSIGAATSVNLGFDGNEIQARNNGYASQLHLNYYGGLVMINNANISSGGLKVRGRLNIPTSAPSNPQEGDIWLVL